MKRTDVSTRLVDANGTGKDGYTNGEPGVTPPTVFDADAGNGFQEEIANVVEASGQTLSGSKLDQLLGALRAAFLHAGLNTPPLLVAETPSTVLATHLAYAGVVTPSAGRVYFVGEAKALLSGVAPYLEVASISTAFATVDYKALCHYGEANKVVVVGEAEEIVSVSSTTATSRNTGGTKTLNAVAWSPDLDMLCAVGDDGKIMTASTSALGTWTARTPGSSYSGDFNDVTWDAINALWIAVGDDREIQTSPDGITWTRRNASAGENFASVASCVSAIVANTTTGSTYRSTDGVTWTAGPAGPSARMHYEDSVLFSYAYTNGDLLVSTDEGASWQTRSIAGGSVHVSVAGGGLAFTLRHGGGATEVYRLGSVNSVGG